MPSTPAPAPWLLYVWHGAPLVQCTTLNGPTIISPPAAMTGRSATPPARTPAAATIAAAPITGLSPNLRMSVLLNKQPSSIHDRHAANACDGRPAESITGGVLWASRDRWDFLPEKTPRDRPAGQTIIEEPRLVTGALARVSRKGLLRRQFRDE